MFLGLSSKLLHDKPNPKGSQHYQDILKAVSIQGNSNLLPKWEQKEVLFK